MNEKPNYYAIIPANVRYDNELRANEKLLYGEITALTQKTGECWASNKYFSELYDVKQNAIATWIRHLKEKKYIRVDYVYKGKEIEKRCIKIGDIQKDTTYSQKDNRGGIQKGEENNTSSINNTREKEIYKEKVYFENEKVNNLFMEFLEIRKKKKAINSDLAITKLVNKLNKYDDEQKCLLLDKSIINSWKDVYPSEKEVPEGKVEWLSEGAFRL